MVWGLVFGFAGLCILVSYVTASWKALWLPALTTVALTGWLVVSMVGCDGELCGLGWIIVIVVVFVGAFITLLSAVAVTCRRWRTQRPTPPRGEATRLNGGHL